jgi:glyoxylase-like metal-dependent hydrolase (beta-lactamase superfamily II)
MLSILLSACVRVPDLPPAALPPAPAPVEATVCWLEYARGDGPASFATRGPTATETFHGTVSGLLIRHPSGDWIVDVGNSLDFLDDLRGYDPWTKFLIKQLPGRMQRVATVPQALAVVGEDPAAVTGILGSHAHLDHVGGAAQLPDVPILLGPDELPFVRELEHQHEVDLLPSQAAVVAQRMQALAWDGPAVGPFPASHDLFGDGSVVIVPMPGHTPGSVGTLIRLPGLPELLHVGDVVMLTEGWQKPAPKGMFVRALDRDPRATADQMAAVHAAAAGTPGLAVLPAHDRDAWEAVFGPTPRCLP